jgi:hypothetical protein
MAIRFYFACLRCPYSLSELDVQRFFQLLELALERLELSCHVYAGLDVIEALFCMREPSARDSSELFYAFANFAVDIFFGSQRNQFFREDLFEAFLGQLSHGCEVNGEGIITREGESVKVLDSPVTYSRGHEKRAGLSLPLSY